MTASEAPLAGVRVDRRVMPHGQYKCILADQPWALAMAGQRKRAKEGKKPEALPYPTMTIDDICSLPVADFAADDCHLWLWTTNQHLEDGFRVMRAWGFKYLAPVHWVKQTGMGNWFVHRSQTMLFGYRQKCRFPLARYRPNVFQTGAPKRHSEKPDASYELIEAVSPGPRLELFARRKRGDWHTWGNEVPCDVSMGHNAKVSGAGTASAGLTGSAAGGLEKGEAMDMAWADKQLPPGVTRQDVCIWTQDSDGPWCGSCGVMWEFIDGGPKDNETHFCPRCGGVLLAEPFAEDETPNT